MSSQARVSIDWWHLKLNFLFSPSDQKKHSFERHKSGIKSHKKPLFLCDCAAKKQGDELLTQKILSAFICITKLWGWKRGKRPDNQKKKQRVKNAIKKRQLLKFNVDETPKAISCREKCWWKCTKKFQLRAEKSEWIKNLVSPRCDAATVNETRTKERKKT